MAKKKTPPAKKLAAKKPAKPAHAKSASSAPPVKKAATPASGKGAKSSISPADLKRLLLERKAAPKAISFSLDEVREIAKKHEKQVETAAKTGKNGRAAASARPSDHVAHVEKPAKPHHVKPASLADILGFNPKRGKQVAAAIVEEKDVPEKYRRYYRILVDLRNHVLNQLGEHAEETLLKSAKDDSGDLSGYGQHMADAGTDTFDRDFALSLVSSEQEALSEIEAAIKRIHDGTYGICESTQKPISKERLLAVPFTRYSTEAKKEVERHSHRSIERGGLFGESGEEEGAKISSEDDGGE